MGSTSVEIMKAMTIVVIVTALVEATATALVEATAAVAVAMIVVMIVIALSLILSTLENATVNGYLKKLKDKQSIVKRGVGKVKIAKLSLSARNHARSIIAARSIYTMY